MSEMNPEQPNEVPDFQTVLSEAADDISSGYASEEARKRSAELVRHQFGNLESPETVRRALTVYREFIEEREREPSSALVVAVGHAIVNFQDDMIKHAVGLFEELHVSGDLGLDEEPSTEDLDIIGHYLTEITPYQTDSTATGLTESIPNGLADVDLAKVAEYFGISKAIRGLELIQLLAKRLEDESLTSEDLFALGIIEAEAYDDIYDKAEQDRLDEATGTEGRIIEEDLNQAEQDGEIEEFDGEEDDDDAEFNAEEDNEDIDDESSENISDVDIF